MLISIEIWSLPKKIICQWNLRNWSFYKTQVYEALTKLWAKEIESNSLLVSVLGWNMTRSGFSSTGICKNSWDIKNEHITKVNNQNNSFHSDIVSKDNSVTLPVLITTIHTHLDLNTELLLSSTRKNSKLKWLVSHLLFFPHSFREKFYVHYSKYRMYRRQLYTKVHEYNNKFSRNTGKKSWLTIWYITAFRTTWRVSKRVNFLLALVMILML